VENSNNMDPRHEERIKIIQNLFAYSFPQLKTNLPYPNDKKTHLIIKEKTKINSLIKKHAKKFPINKIAKIDLAILWLSIYELLIAPKEPGKAIINEAIELAKEMGGERSYAFINAILGKIINKQNDKLS
jgi:transcription antitermination protein NusB